MLLTRIYYRLKPFVPKRLRWALRRLHARKILKHNQARWPILESAASPPLGWPGWPDKKQFAFVLSHDVESKLGVDRVKELAELEMELGFRSSFNFIPEGPYDVSKELRQWLVENGFEVGVHDLRHDGHLYDSKEGFSKNAERINHHLQDWNAVGFRSGFMLRELDWLHDLDVLYDASTFDTDPLEPQPNGEETIYPFIISNGASSYVELPYTLAQDSTLFLLLQEKTPAIWLKKLDWVAEKGGMALMNVHPDYMALSGNQPSRYEYPLSHYRELLSHVRSQFKDQYWHVLPKEMAEFVSQMENSNGEKSAIEVRSKAPGSKKPKIWIDLDNTPHVPFFIPILDELKARGFPLLVTARDAFQVCELADKMGLGYTKIGRHYGKHRLMKGAGLVYRAAQLLPTILREKPSIGVSHGARSQLILGKRIGIPTLLLEDYEYSQFPSIMTPTWEMAPEALTAARQVNGSGPIESYPGIKEDVYAWNLKPDQRLLDELGLSKQDIIATVRPPATEAHYHNPEAELLFERFMNRACATEGVKVVMLPRNKKQGVWIRERWPDWFVDGKTMIPKTAVDGMNLIWHSDLVVSGGGTMNREAAALGVPVYSIFRGTIGGVDRHLAKEGKLILIESVEDADEKIPLVKRPLKSVSDITSKKTLHAIVDHIVGLAEKTGK